MKNAGTLVFRSLRPNSCSSLLMSMLMLNTRNVLQTTQNEQDITTTLHAANFFQWNIFLCRWCICPDLALAKTPVATQLDLLHSQSLTKSHFRFLIIVLFQWWQKWSVARRHPSAQFRQIFHCALLDHLPFCLGRWSYVWDVASSGIIISENGCSCNPSSCVAQHKRVFREQR